MIDPSTVSPGNYARFTDKAVAIGIYNMSACDKMHPIKITERRLDKFPLDKNGDIYSFKTSEGNIIKIYLSKFVSKDEQYWNIVIGSENYPIKFIHDLQNLYRFFTGQLLTLKEGQKWDYQIL